VNFTRGDAEIDAVKNLVPFHFRVQIYDVEHVSSRWEILKSVSFAGCIRVIVREWVRLTGNAC
jgi:hypothetical protein